MRLLIVRHCDPDYSVDSLTETGWKEAKALAKYMRDVPMDACYVSPLGRARDTANACLDPLGKTAEVCEWLREFKCPVKGKRFADVNFGDYAWDWLPADWLARPGFFDREKWMDEPEFAAEDMRGCYGWVCEGLDGLLEKHGYRRDGLSYRVVKPNHDTVVLFCHFGLECVLLSHLINCSPMILWHGTCSAPSGVTELYTEEREEGIACWRMSRFGDVSHLYAEGLEPSFHARFCECFTDETRH